MHWLCYMCLTILHLLHILFDSGVHTSAFILMYLSRWIPALWAWEQERHLTWFPRRCVWHDCLRCRCEAVGGSRAGAGGWPGGVCCCCARRPTRGSSRGSPTSRRHRPPSSARRSCCLAGSSTRSEYSSGRATTSASATRGSCTPSSGTAWLAPTRKVRTLEVLLGLAHCPPRLWSSEAMECAILRINHFLLIENCICCVPFMCDQVLPVTSFYKEKGMLIPKC